MPDLLTHDAFAGPGADPADPSLRTAFVLHGILGSKRNWRTFARALARDLEGWRIVTVDHRNHGDAPPMDGPHTVAACASDLARLAEHLGDPPEVVVGHSFGGKVALAYARDHGATLAQVWALDALPLPDPEPDSGEHEVRRVMEALRTIPVPLTRREDVVQPLLDQGLSEGLARWMTTNLERTDGGYRWRFDLDGAAEMIGDYFTLDLSGVVSAPRIQPEVHLVRAERSDRWTPDVLATLDDLCSGAPSRLHTLADAGHWVHADNPDGLREMLLEWWPI